MEFFDGSSPNSRLRDGKSQDKKGVIPETIVIAGKRAGMKFGRAGFDEIRRTINPRIKRLIRVRLSRSRPLV